VNPPSVVVATPDELRAIVRDELRAILLTREPATSAPAPLLDKRGLAAALGVSPATVDRQTAEGRIPFVRVGDHKRFDLAAVRAALELTPARLAPVVAPARGRVPGVRLLSRGPRTA
jgi:excisionase family DNA binding protein